MNKFELFHIYAETPVHAGSGSDIGIVDLPIQRERYTDHPVIWSSSLKGSIRDYSRKNNVKDQNFLFGPEDVSKPEDAEAGHLAFSDAKILAFPVRSVKMPFIWITCPMVISKYNQAVSMTNAKAVLPFKPDFKAEALVSSEACMENGEVFVEEFSLKSTKDEIVKLFAEYIAKNAIPQDQVYDYLRQHIQNALVLVKDDLFTFFVKNLTEVNPRIRIDPKTGVVENGALWYEEDLPEDTIMYFTVSYDENDKCKNFVDNFDGKRFSVGGNKTIGKGIFTARRLK
ncbi:type III-B CRISPR module RAMP protein Cmr4 [Athalassotoga sp.]|uniref:Type III-B CRISPR module RAMP protein Cmr4 n=1 Tax=Caldisericum exile TaxID=693075 RepID=A0A2J6X463_9BACT|nr:MAG: type III-B CRISPR module RAMP protein Cmr4 [Caldisericum exile]HEU24506.1 type III-B CRISPR module RAMP protein Cmr4 [Mesoaciditoga lauensis]